VNRVVATERPAGGMTYRRLHAPASVFVLLYGLAKLAELADWGRLHRDVGGMLGAGSGATTGLVAAGKGAELLFTVLAALALARRAEVLLLTALAGWTADLAVLATVAAVCGDRGRLLEHGLAFVAFGSLLTVVHAYGQVRAADVVGSVLRRSRDVEEPHADETVRDARPDETRRDLPVRGVDQTRLDLPVRRPDQTRQDLPVRKPAP
jgi:hypothetical protein